MKRSIIVALAIILALATTALAADKKEEAKANTPVVQQAAPQAQKQPTLADYQNALTLMQGKAQAYKQIEDGLRQSILRNEIQASKIQEKIIELTPKPPAKP